MRFFLILFLGLFTTVSFARATVSTLVADTKSGYVIASQDALVQQPPASLTKVMTLYMLFGALENGLLTMDDELPISKKAESQPRSKIYVKEGETITVREAILALIVKSANDVAVVVAEALGDTEERFAKLMTEMAGTLGLKNTVFKNASGLHQEGQVTTARDMAVLTMALIEHYPQYYDLFSTPSFTYKGQTYYSHNTVMEQYEGAEGLKTGFVSAVGYNIISTAKQGDSRLVGVVIGEKTQLKRDLRAMRLLDKGFQQIKIQKKAENSGQLKSVFNPLNRKAFILKPSNQLYVPLMQNCISSCKQKVESLSGKKKEKIAVQEKKSPLLKGDCWSIQVGAFEGKEKAYQTALKALNVLGMADKQIETPQANERFYRSRIQGFSSKLEANNACQKLQGSSWQCFAIAP